MDTCGIWTPLSSCKDEVLPGYTTWPVLHFEAESANCLCMTAFSFAEGFVRFPGIPTAYSVSKIG